MSIVTLQFNTTATVEQTIQILPESGLTPETLQAGLDSGELITSMGFDREAGTSSDVLRVDDDGAIPVGTVLSQTVIDADYFEYVLIDDEGEASQDDE